MPRPPDEHDIYKDHDDSDSTWTRRLDTKRRLDVDDDPYDKPPIRRQRRRQRQDFTIHICHNDSPKPSRPDTPKPTRAPCPLLRPTQGPRPRPRSRPRPSRADDRPPLEAKPTVNAISAANKDLRNQRLQWEEEMRVKKPWREELLNEAVEFERRVAELHRMEVEDGWNTLNRCWEDIVQPRLTQGLKFRREIRQIVEEAWRHRYHGFEADVGGITPPMPREWMPEHEDNFRVDVGGFGFKSALTQTSLVKVIAMSHVCPPAVVGKSASPEGRREAFAESRAQARAREPQCSC